MNVTKQTLRAGDKSDINISLLFLNLKIKSEQMRSKAVLAHMCFLFSKRHLKRMNDKDHLAILQNKEFTHVCAHKGSYTILSTHIWTNHSTFENKETKELPRKMCVVWKQPHPTCLTYIGKKAGTLQTGKHQTERELHHRLGYSHSHITASVIIVTVTSLLRL